MTNTSGNSVGAGSSSNLTTDESSAKSLATCFTGNSFDDPTGITGNKNKLKCVVE